MEQRAIHRGDACPMCGTVNDGITEWCAHFARYQDLNRLQTEEVTKRAERKMPPNTTAWKADAGLWKGDAVRHFRSGKMAKDAVSFNAVEIREHRNWPGSPPPAFGYEEGPEREEGWPVVSLLFHLPHGRTDLRAQLTEQLKQLVDSFIAEHDLNTLDSEE